MISIGALVIYGLGAIPFYEEEWFWAMMQFFAVLISLGFIYWQVRTQTKAHIVQTLADLHNQWNSRQMIRARLKVCNDWLNDDFRFDGADEYVAEFLEQLGLYARSSAISNKALWSTMSWYIENYYAMCEPEIKRIRKEYGDELFYKGFQDLNAKMQAISKSMNSPLLGGDKILLKKFAEIEKNLGIALLEIPSEGQRGSAKSKRRSTPGNKERQG